MSISGFGASSWGWIDKWSYSQANSLLSIAGKTLTGNKHAAVSYPEGLALTRAAAPPAELSSVHRYILVQNPSF